MTLPRRWSFRFTLRTLFVVVGLVCCWCAYQLDWIRHRHAFIDEAKRAEKSDSESMLAILWSDLILKGSGMPSSSKLPFSLQIFGEGAVVAIAVVKDVGPEPIAQAKRLFPEAHFVEMWPAPDPEADYLRLELEEVLGPMSGWPVVPSAQ